MAAIFDGTNIFENFVSYSAELSYVSKILSKMLYLARFSRYKHFYVLQSLRKIRKFKMAAIFGVTKSFENWVSYSVVTLQVKIFIKIALSRTVFEI